MKFYIDISSATPCFAKQIGAICRKKNYQFLPQNKTYYLVDTDEKTCTGVTSMVGGYEVVTEAHGYLAIKKKLI